MEEKQIKKLQNALNSRPIEAFDFLSPYDMDTILYNTYSNESPIQFKEDTTDEILDNLGFLNLCNFILKRLERDGEIKLTTRGNVSTSFATEIFHKKFTSEEVFVLKPRKIYRQDDLMSLQNAMIILYNILKLIKKRKNKLTLTKKGEEVVGSYDKLQIFKLMFITYAVDLNLGFHDGYEEEFDIQRCFGFVLYLLLKYGNKERKVEFYGDKFITAFPHLLESFQATYSSQEKQLTTCLCIRIFVRFLEWFNLIDMHDENGKFPFGQTYIKSKYLHDIFTLETSNFRFKKSEFEA